eukprot:gene822-1139_t
MVADSNSDQDRAWITIKADNYECLLSVNKLRALPNSHLANLADIELQGNHVNPSIRLDCEPEVAKELVAIVRHGSSYAAPTDNPRLFQALQHQLDFYLGIPVPNVRAGSGSSLQEYLVLPMSASGEELMMYSSRAHGWAVAPCSSYWPDKLSQDAYIGGYHVNKWLAAALPAEENGLGKCTDVALMLPNDPLQQIVVEGSNGLMLKSDLSWGTFAASNQHQLLGDSAMVAAQGQLYLLGGRPRRGWGLLPEPPLRGSPTFQVFDPHVNQWFDGPSPYPKAQYLFNHTLVSNKAEAMLLSIGGWLTDASLEDDDWHNGFPMLHAELTRPMTDQ